MTTTDAWRNGRCRICNMLHDKQKLVYTCGACGKALCWASLGYDLENGRNHWNDSRLCGPVGLLGELKPNDTG